MGQLIKFPDRAELKTPIVKSDAPVNVGSGRKKAEVLFFTGVRYERRLSLPSERLKAPRFTH